MSSSVPNFGDAERKMAGKRKASVWFSALRISASVGMFVEAEMSAMASTTATVGNEGTGTEGTGTEGGRRVRLPLLLIKWLDDSRHAAG